MAPCGCPIAARCRVQLVGIGASTLKFGFLSTRYSREKAGQDVLWPHSRSNLIPLQHQGVYYCNGQQALWLAGRWLCHATTLVAGWLLV
jgi:hypothetical protein